MTDLEKRAIAALCNLELQDLGWYAHCVVNLNMRMTLQPQAPLRWEQHYQLWYIVWSHRREIKDPEVLAYARKYKGGGIANHKPDCKCPFCKRAFGVGE